jgi:hypothetical protein
MNLATKRQRNMFRFALKHKLSDDLIIRVVAGTVSKAELYGTVLGRHPTKKGR